MKTILKIIIIIIVIYLSWILFIKPSKENVSNKQTKIERLNNLLTIKGEVKNNFVLLNQAIIVVKELESHKLFYVLMINADTPKIGTPVIMKIKKYDIIKINDKSITLYQENNNY